MDNGEKVLIYEKKRVVFAGNFHSTRSFDGYFVRVGQPGKYKVVMSTDDFCYGGFGRVYHQHYTTVEQNGNYGIEMYLPNRTGVVLKLCRGAH